MLGFLLEYVCIFVPQANFVFLYELSKASFFNFNSLLTSANLTGHVERVGIENFELLKVLGTGGE